VLYAALAQAGYFPHDEIMSLRKLPQRPAGGRRRDFIAARDRPTYSDEPAPSLS
jgi:hypothetical protein